MLEAHDRAAVLAWSERQLGEAAKRVTVVAMDEDSTLDQVEKSGTGIRQCSCEPFLSFMADSIQHLVEKHEGELFFLNHDSGSGLASRESSFH